MSCQFIAARQLHPGRPAALTRSPTRSASVLSIQRLAESHASWAAFSAGRTGRHGQRAQARVRWVGDPV